MSEGAKKGAVYEDLYDVPENMIGEIIDGELVVTPRPSPRHSHTASVLGGELIPPYRFGRGGPGGWIILGEVEILFGRDLLVPDLSGWRRERFPGWPSENWFSVAPDWVCEVLSPGTAARDKVAKLNIYASHGVQHYWLVDPHHRTLDVLQLGPDHRWVVWGSFAGDAKVRAEPFPETELNLQDLWAPEPGSGLEM